MIDRTRPLLPLTLRWFYGVSGIALAILAAPFVGALGCLLGGGLSFAVCGLWIVVVSFVFILLAVAPLLLGALVIASSSRKGQTQVVAIGAAFFLLVVTIGLFLGTDWASWCWQKQSHNLIFTWGSALSIWQICLNGAWFLCKLFLEYKVYWGAAAIWTTGIGVSAFTFSLIILASAQGIVLRVFSKIRLRCPRCGNSSPRVLCSGCTELHDDLYPTRYGIWKVACAKCSRSLPTTVLGQRKLEKVCVCGYGLCHPDLGCLPEFHIAVVGAKNGGKSLLMTAALEFLDNHFAPANEYELTFPSPAEENEYRDRIRRLQNGQLLPQTARSNRPTAFTISMKKKGTGRGCLLYFYDAAGEDIQEGASEGKGLSGHEFHAFIDAVILVVDPFAEEGLRREITGGGVLPQNVNSATHDAHYVLGRMIPHWARSQGVSADRRFAFPIAVVLTKMDASGLASRAGGFVQLDRRYSSFAEAAEDAESLSDQVRRLLELSGSVDLLRLLESHFRDIRFFGASSLGRMADSHNSTPFQSQGAFAPLAWLLHQTKALSVSAASLRSVRFLWRDVTRSLQGMEGSRARWTAYAAVFGIGVAFVGGLWCVFGGTTLTDVIPQERIQALGKDNDGLRLDESQKVKQMYHDLMRDRALQAAGKLLVEQKAEVPDLDTLKDDFRAKSLKILTDQKSELIREKRWAEARQILIAFQADRHAMALVSYPDLWRIDGMKIEIDAAEDNYLYSLLRVEQTQTTEAIQAYLANAPLKGMKREVEALQDYKKKMAQPLVVEAKIIWGSSCWDNYENSVRIWADGTELQGAINVLSVQGKESNLAAKTLVRPSTDRINFRVAIQVTNGWFPISSREHGAGSGDFTMTELLAGRELTLDKFNNRVVFRSNNVAIKPSMPEWRGRPVDPPRWWFYSIYAACAFLVLGAFIYRVVRAAPSN